jgi:hypothetical protein
MLAAAEFVAINLFAKNSFRREHQIGRAFGFYCSLGWVEKNARVCLEAENANAVSANLCPFLQKFHQTWSGCWKLLRLFEVQK